MFDSLSKIKDFLQSHKKLVLLILIFSFFYYFLISPVLNLVLIGRSLPEKLKPIRATVSGSVSGLELSRDLEFLVFELEYFKDTMVEIDDNVSRMQIFSKLPFVGSYFADMKVLSSVSLEMTDISVEMVSSMESLIPDLNLRGWGSTENLSEGEVTQTLSEISRVLADELPNYEKRLMVVNKKINTINVEKYPKEVRGVRVREYLSEIKSLSTTLLSSYDDIIEIIEILPDLAGERGTKQYLVFLQNDGALRPSGGVLSAYAVFTVNRGNLGIAKSGDVFILDSKAISYTPPIGYINRFTGAERYFLADGGYSADFSESARSINDYWATLEDSSKVDGIILIDTKVISGILDIVGEIEIPSFGTFTSSNVSAQLQEFFSATGNVDEQSKTLKGNTSTLLYALMTESFSTSTQERADLLSRIYKEAKEKHMVVYFSNAKLQELAQDFNITGKIREYGGDYLYVSNANFSNVSYDDINQRVTKSVVIEDKILKNRLELEYENASTIGEVFKNYVRVFVPKSSQLTSSLGSLIEVETGSEFGKTFFEGYIEVNQGNKSVLVLEYDTPLDGVDFETYTLLVQKQPGAKTVAYEIKAGEISKGIDLSSDTEVVINFK